jgi:hypothetical protein
MDSRCAPPNSGSQSRTWHETSSGSCPHRILVADDELSIRKLFMKKLQTAGYEAVGAGSGRSTLKELPRRLVRSAHSRSRHARSRRLRRAEGRSRLNAASACTLGFRLHARATAGGGRLAGRRPHIMTFCGQSAVSHACAGAFRPSVAPGPMTRSASPSVMPSPGRWHFIGNPCFAYKVP